MINKESLLSLVRKNVQQLNPYSSARDEFTDEAEIFLDANENPYNWEYNRYPDPYQNQLKEEIAKWRNVKKESIFIGNGSDEIIDLLIRAFCEPDTDSIISLNPSYGMYKVSAAINNVEVRYFDLDENFKINITSILNYFEKPDKILFLCSPNNPSGNCIAPEDVVLMCKTFHGLVVLDEAYIDFSNTKSLVEMVGLIPNLIVLQTMSKALGAAGIRLGMAFMAPEIVQILNKIKPPYNVNGATQQIAVSILTENEKSNRQISQIISERTKLNEHLKQLNFVVTVYPSEANFILVEVKDADALYKYLLKNGIVVRRRDKEFRCQNCIRITIGTSLENDILIQKLSNFQNIH